MSGPLVLILRILLALALYAFLCLVLWMTWQDLRRAGLHGIRPKIPALHIEVSPPGAETFSRTFTQPEVTLGRDPKCEVHLDDEAVSARHAKFSFHQGHWWVEDMRSKNGTKLNQIKLKRPAVLTGGDEVRCGETRMIVKPDTNTTGHAGAPMEERHDREG